MIVRIERYIERIQTRVQFEGEEEILKEYNISNNPLTLDEFRKMASKDAVVTGKRHRYELLLDHEKEYWKEEIMKHVNKDKWLKFKMLFDVFRKYKLKDQIEKEINSFNNQTHSIDITNYEEDEVAFPSGFNYKIEEEMYKLIREQLLKREKSDTVFETNECSASVGYPGKLHIGSLMPNKGYAVKTDKSYDTIISKDGQKITRKNVVHGKYYQGRVIPVFKARVDITFRIKLETVDPSRLGEEDVERIQLHDPLYKVIKDKLIYAGLAAANAIYEVNQNYKAEQEAKKKKKGLFDF